MRPQYVPMNDTKALGDELQIHSFLMSALDGGSELHASAALAPSLSLSQVTAPVPIDRILGGSHCCYWSFGGGKNIFPLPQIEPQFSVFQYKTW